MYRPASGQSVVSLVKGGAGRHTGSFKHLLHAQLASDVAQLPLSLI
jgi:hypothetical protein